LGVSSKHLREGWGLALTWLPLWVTVPAHSRRSIKGCHCSYDLMPRTLLHEGGLFCADPIVIHYGIWNPPKCSACNWEEHHFGALILLAFSFGQRHTNKKRTGPREGVPVRLGILVLRASELLRANETSSGASARATPRKKPRGVALRGLRPGFHARANSGAHTRSLPAVGPALAPDQAFRRDQRFLRASPQMSGRRTPCQTRGSGAHAECRPTRPAVPVPRQATGRGRWTGRGPHPLGPGTPRPARLLGPGPRATRT
jgi:hypothetical protein